LLLAWALLRLAWARERRRGERWTVGVGKRALLVAVLQAREKGAAGW
jgi:hypothetical protein